MSNTRHAVSDTGHRHRAHQHSTKQSRKLDWGYAKCLAPPSFSLRRVENGDVAVDDELPPSDGAAFAVDDDILLVNADTALFRRLKIVPVAPLLPAHFLKIRPFLALQFAMRI